MDLRPYSSARPTTRCAIERRRIQLGPKPPPRSHFPILPPRTLVSPLMRYGKRFSIRRIPGDCGIPLRFQLHQTPSARLRSHLRPESDDFLDRRFRHGGNYHAEVHDDRTWTQLDTNIGLLQGDHVFEPYPQGNRHSIFHFIACYVG